MLPQLSQKSEQRCYFSEIKKTSRKKEIFGKIFSPQNRAKMAGESISGGHIADKQRLNAQSMPVKSPFLMPTQLQFVSSEIT